MFLGIEIGGTKLQLGVGAGDGPDLVAVERLNVDPARGGAGIREQILKVGRDLVARFDVERIAYGFGGPIDAAAGIVTTSHQVEGWDGFPLVEWTTKELGRPTILGNDCDAAALAEARFGAGRGSRIVFFITVGTGVGGGLVIDGALHAAYRPAVAEIGHLRPTLDPDQPQATVEDMASGRGIEQETRRRLALSSASRQPPDAHHREDLLQRCGNNPEQISGKIVAEAAAAGNKIARDVLSRACRALGWGIAQVLAIAAPEVIVIGGGVSLIGDELFFEPLRAEVERQVFRPLAGSYRIEPAALGELVVVHGAVLRAAGGNSQTEH
ncbi:MAG: ROK family protein [Planctomycetaceae bacterium]